MDCPPVRRVWDGKETMQALVYSQSALFYLLRRTLNSIFPHRFFGLISGLKLKEIPFNSRGSDWVILRNRICGICGSDLQLLRGRDSVLMEPYGSFPAVLGHEIVAEVASPTPDALWQTGDRVVVEPLIACEERGLLPCGYCVKGKYNLCENSRGGSLTPGNFIGYNRSIGGGMAEFMTVHVSRIIRLPDSLPDEKAVLTDSLASALQPVLDHFPNDSETVVVYGAGILGQHTIRALRCLGSKASIVAVTRHAFQDDLARSGGADKVLRSPGRAELGNALGAGFIPTTLGGGNLDGGADIFFDCVGSQRSLQEGLLALRSSGKLVMVGTAASISRIDISSLWFRELHLVGSVAAAHSLFRGRDVHTYQLAVDLLASQSYDAKGLVTHLFPLREYGKAFAHAFDRPHFQSVKVALNMRGGGGT